MRTLTVQLEIEKTDSEGNVLGYPEVTVEAEYIFERGSLGDYGVRMEPDYESMKIVEVTDEDGSSTWLSARDEERAIEALYEKLKDE